MLDHGSAYPLTCAAPVALVRSEMVDQHLRVVRADRLADLVALGTLGEQATQFLDGAAVSMGTSWSRAGPRPATRQAVDALPPLLRGLSVGGGKKECARVPAGPSKAF